MRYRHILQLLLEPQLITPQAHGGMFQFVLGQMDKTDMPKRDGENICGEKVELQSMTVEDGLAIIPAGGVMAFGLSAMERGSGVLDMADLEKDIAFSNQNDSVKGIFMDWDTPGGMYQHLPELSDVIASSKKPIISFTQGQLCSAGIYAAAPSKAIIATKSAAIGSIGAYTVHADLSQMLKNQGIEVQVFATDIYKGAGVAGTSLSDAQKALLQERIDRMGAEFKAHMIRHRGQIPAEAMRGQSFLAQEAMDNNLIDGIVSSRSEAVALAKEMCS